jgi:hypothetical protein
MFNDHPREREETRTFYILFVFFPVRVVNPRLVAALLPYSITPQHLRCPRESFLPARIGRNTNFIL